MREDCPSWFKSRGLLADLGRWQSLATDAAAFWGFADDYLNELESQNPNATRAEIEAFRDQIDSRYSDYWWD